MPKGTPSRTVRSKNANSKNIRRHLVQVTWGDVLGLSSSRQPNRQPQKGKKQKEDLFKRQLRMEELEQRLALSVNPIALNALEPPPDIQFGSVYYEHPAGLGMDYYGDVFQVSWTGGAEGTQLKELRIDLDKNQNGQLDPGECFFDTAGKNGGTYGYYPFTIIATEGVTVKDWSVDDGGQLLVIRFSDFLADGKFVFMLDVDEYNINEDGTDGTSALVEGKEFELSHLFCTFTHPDYEVGEAHLVFYDRFNDPKDVGLNLPDVGYDMNPPHEVLTAAAVGPFTQTPKNGSLSGYVYEDNNNNGIKETGEKGIAGVTLKLWVWDGTKYVDTGHVTTTNQDGFYKFENLVPFKKYRVTEIQPVGYADGLDKEGSLGGLAVNPGDEILDINVGPNQHGTDYNFGELKCGSISGYVYEDYNCDGRRQESETPIQGVTLELWVWDDATQKYVDTGLRRETNQDGFYKFENLDPLKKYRVIEVLTEAQRAKYFNGRQEVGSLGGQTLTPPEKTITEILVGIGQDGLGYNFANRLPASISGYVYEDKNDNGVKESGETGIPGVELELWYISWANRDAFLTSPDQSLYEYYGKTTTDANGYYRFGHLDPCLIYAVREKQPEEFLDGKDTPGGTGRVDVNDEITDITLKPDEEDGNNNFGELRPGKISGYVFQEGDTVHLYPGDPAPTVAPPDWNGRFEDATKRIANVVLSLADENGVPLRDANGNLITVQTNAQGYYEFTHLKPGRYSVLELQPNGYLDGIDTPGTTGGKAINIYDTATIEELRAAGVNVDSLNNDAIVGILLPYAAHSTMNNFSELHVLWDLDPPKPPKPPGGPEHPHYRPDPPIGVSGLFPGGGYSYWPSPHGDRYSQESGGGGLPAEDYTWHLSIINAGTPRGTDSGEISQYQASLIASGTYKPVSWRPMNNFSGKWIIRGKDGKAIEKFRFGDYGSRPVVGNFNGDGTAQIAVFHDGFWYIDLNGNGEWDEGDMVVKLGTALDQPVVGDWDGDGKTDIGIFGPKWEEDDRAIESTPGLPSDLNQRIAARPKNVPPRVDQAPIGFRAMQHTSQGRPRIDLIDHVFQYGSEGDIAISGDFTGDGITKIGVYRNGDLYLDINGDGRFEEGVDRVIRGIGRPGEVPVVGDFNGDGIDEVAMFKDGYWRIDTTGNFVLDTEIRFGEVGDLPFAGDFTGDGYAQLGVFRPEMDSESTGLLTQRENTGEFPTLATPAKQYADQYQIEIETQTIKGGLPDHLNNRTERTMRSSNF